MANKYYMVLLLFAATILSGYTLPFHGAQSVYYRDTIGQKQVSRVTFKSDQSPEEITITKADQRSSNPLKFVLANLFLTKKSHFSAFGHRIGIASRKTHFALIEETPVICYGRKAAKDTGSMLCLENEQFYPVRLVFNQGTDPVTVDFTHYNYEDRGYRFPTQVEITTKGETTIYNLSKPRLKR